MFNLITHFQNVHLSKPGYQGIASQNKGKKQNLVAFCDKDTGGLVVKTRERQQMLYTLVLAKIRHTVEAPYHSTGEIWAG